MPYYQQSMLRNRTCQMTKDGLLARLLEEYAPMITSIFVEAIHFASIYRTNVPYFTVMFKIFSTLISLWSFC